MCTILSATTAAVGVLSSLISVQSAYSEKKAAKHQTEVLISQAKKAERNAAIERQEGIDEARREKLDAILNMSEQKATIAASNLATTSQTSLNIMDDEKLNGELEALTTMKDAQRRSDAYLDSAEKYYNEAALNSFNSKLAFQKKLVNTATRLSSLSTAGLYGVKNAKEKN